MLLEYIKHIKQQWLQQHHCQQLIDVMQTVVFTLGQQLLLLEFLYNILVLCALEKNVAIVICAWF